MICRNCGKDIADGSPVCNYCGYTTEAPGQQPMPMAPNTINALPMTVGSYIITLIVLAIPLVGFIMSLVWSFSSNVNINKKNLCRAILIIYLVSALLSIVIALVTGFSISMLTDLWESYPTT